MKFKLLAIGKTDKKELQTLSEDYIYRINRYIPFQLEIIPDIKNAKNLSEKEQKKQEGIKILEKCPTNCVLVLLDEKGNTFHSVEFASYIQQKLNSGVKEVVFVIGGPYGFSEEVYARANDKIALSKLTFSHQMVRLFFAEQVYRAFTILNNEPYHHQ
jgi:23S rRNA (pseudouridine1915-N3)-methyltransferase